MLPSKGNQEWSNVVRMHGQFREDQEVDCMAVVTSHVAMRVSQPPHLFDPLKCRHKVRSVPQSKRRVAEVGSSGVACVVRKVGNHRLNNANTKWPYPISGVLWSVQKGGRLLQEERPAMGPIMQTECVPAGLNRCADFGETATARQYSRPGPPEKFVEQIFYE